MAIRKDANTLSSQERAEFVAAVFELKRSGVYDQFVLRHALTPMADIHRSSAFLPWHRRFIWDFERELQRVSGNPDLGLPYWNWPSGGENASMWNDDLLGGDGNALTGVVETGPFREGEWSVINSSGVDTGPLTRFFGRSSPQVSRLSTQAEIDQVLAITPYDSPPWQAGSAPSFRDQIEGWSGPNLHNRGHVWVGGSMLPMTSPNDPVFFMHHCMVDKVWHEWQQRFPAQGYLPTSGGRFGQNLTDPMAGTPDAQIGSRPIDVLDSAAIGIEYDALMPGTPTSSVPDGETLQELTVNAAAVGSGINLPGEVDRYRFQVDQFASYTMETFGNSDTFMTLFGPDDPNREVATNDDGGQNLNARIQRNLSAGRYFLQLRLYSPQLTGDYQVQIRRVGSDAPPATSIPELLIDAPAFNAAISAQQESDLYRFTISTSGTYTIETLGVTDMFLDLFGPNDQTSQLTSDDDSGTGLNARIRIDLSPGEYFVRVRHFSPNSTGPYQVRIVST